MTHDTVRAINDALIEGGCELTVSTETELRYNDNEGNPIIVVVNDEEVAIAMDLDADPVLVEALQLKGFDPEHFREEELIGQPATFDEFEEVQMAYLDH